MKRVTIYICISILLLMATALAGFTFAQSNKAQPPAPPGVAMRIMELKLKPAMGFEFENWLKTDILPGMKKAGAKEFGVWKTEQFGNPAKYFLVSPITNMADLDKEAPFFKALGPEGMAAMMAKVQRLIESIQLYSIIGQPNLTIEPKPGYVDKIGVLVTNHVAPGRETEFERNSKEIMAAIGKTNAKGFLTFRLGLGGNPNEFTTLVLFDSFADLEKFEPAFMKALAEMKLSPEAGVVVHREYEVIRQIPELTIPAPTQAAAK